MALVGPRCIGKTSLLFHLSDPTVFSAYSLSQADYFFIYLDCSDLHNLDQNSLCRFLLEQVHETLLDRNLRPGAFIRPDEGAPVTFHAFERTCRNLTRQGWKLILLLDDFERLSQNPYLDADFFSGLHALAAQCF